MKWWPDSLICKINFMKPLTMLHLKESYKQWRNSVTKLLLTLPKKTSKKQNYRKRDCCCKVSMNNKISHKWKFNLTFKLNTLRELERKLPNKRTIRKMLKVKIKTLLLLQLMQRLHGTVKDWLRENNGPQKLWTTTKTWKQTLTYKLKEKQRDSRSTKKEWKLTRSTCRMRRWDSLYMPLSSN